MWFSSTCIPEGWEMCSGDLSEEECPEDDTETEFSFTIDASAAEITDPPGVGLLFLDYITLPDLLGVTVLTRSARELVLAHTDSSAEAQHTCWPTSAIGVSWTEGSTYEGVAFGEYLTTGLDMARTSEPITWAGTFDDTADTIEDMSLGISLDMRALDDSAGFSSDELCGLLTSFGLRCITCTDGIDYCLELRIDALRADRSDIPVVEISDFCE
jgi:hypothetical protein